MSRAKECVRELLTTPVCDFSAVAGHPRVVEMQLTLEAGQTAVDFVCRDNVDGKRSLNADKLLLFLTDRTYVTVEIM